MKNLLMLNQKVEPMLATVGVVELRRAACHADAMRTQQ